MKWVSTNPSLGAGKSSPAMAMPPELVRLPRATVHLSYQVRRSLLDGGPSWAGLMEDVRAVSSHYDEPIGERVQTDAVLTPCASGTGVRGPAAPMARRQCPGSRSGDDEHSARALGRQPA